MSRQNGHRSAMGTHGIVLTVGVALAAGGCSAAGRADSASAGTAAPASGRGSAVVSTRDLAEVDQLLAVRAIQPGESLAVRLVGAIGPNGSYALDTIDVQQGAGSVLLLPRVRQLPGDFFVQMVVPLDHTVRVALPAGRTRIEARGRTGAKTVEVLVQDGVRREPPQAFVDLQAVTHDGDTLVTSLRVEGRVAEGFVDKLEVREAGGRWQAPEFVERTADGVHGTFTLRRVPGDPERRIEARVRDGQGSWSSVVGSILRAR